MGLEDIAKEVMEPTIARCPEVDNLDNQYWNFIEDVREDILSKGAVHLEQLLEEGNQRFKDVLPASKTRDVTVALIGAGGLGNWIWRVLLGMGFRNIAIFDDDTVGPENIGPQAHSIIDIGLPKVEAIRRQAMMFRGINLRVYKRRVMRFQDLREALGYTPSIVIGATDSMECRNTFLEELVSKTDFPWVQGVDLYVDLRMALGDWNCFVLTPQKLALSYNGEVRNVLARYRNLAKYEASEGVQEPCTARAITYTGANVASYVGALLHWWLMEGSTREAEWFLNYFYKDARDDTEFNWLYRYSSRDFMAQTRTRAEEAAIATAVQARAYKNLACNLADLKLPGVGVATDRIPDRVDTRNATTPNGAAFMAMDDWGNQYIVLRSWWGLDEDDLGEDCSCLKMQLVFNLLKGTAQMTFVPDWGDEADDDGKLLFSNPVFTSGNNFIVAKQLPFVMNYLLPYPDAARQMGATEEYENICRLAEVCPELHSGEPGDYTVEQLVAWQTAEGYKGVRITMEQIDYSRNKRTFAVTFRSFDAEQKDPGTIGVIPGTMKEISPSQFGDLLANGLGQVSRTLSRVTQTACFSGIILEPLSETDGIVMPKETLMVDFVSGMSGHYLDFRANMVWDLDGTGNTSTSEDNEPTPEDSSTTQTTPNQDDLVTIQVPDGVVLDVDAEDTALSVCVPVGNLRAGQRFKAWGKMYTVLEKGGESLDWVMSDNGERMGIDKRVVVDPIFE